MEKNILKLRGSNHFRLKIAYSVLLQKNIEISHIRHNSVNPGLAESEISFLKLVEKLTNGTKIEISKTGTVLKFVPGVITNNYGDPLEFDCDLSRNLTYYLEGIIPICFYGKESLQIMLNGITNNESETSCDTFKNVTVQLLSKLVIGDKVEFDILKRGVAPLGGGKIKFKLPIITFLNNFDWVEEGKIKRMRGTAFTSRLPGAFSTRMIDACRGVFNNFLPDVWIAVDNFKSKNKEEISQGYGLSIYGETNNKFFFSTDIIFSKDQDEEFQESTKKSNTNSINTPEDLARKCAHIFLEEILFCGAVDSHHLSLFLFLMAISTNHLISKLKVGRMNKQVEGVIRLIYQLLGVKFKISEQDEYDEEIDEEEENQEENEEDFEDLEQDFGVTTKHEEEKINPRKFIFSCLGIGLKNSARIEE